MTTPPLITTHTLPPVPAIGAATFVLPAQIEWHQIIPRLGDRSPRHAVLHQDSSTGAATMLVWLPCDFHVPEHWHTASEKHYILQGKLIIQCPTGEAELVPGAFNYMPARMPHQAWTREEDCLLINTVDSTWDVRWTGDGPDRQKGKFKSEA